MIDITDDIYRRTAERLNEEIAVSDWFNGAVELYGEEVYCRLILTAIIYRRIEHLPEGIRRPVCDIVPVWWEFSTVGEGGAIPNNFSFNELKPYLIDYD